MCAGICLGQACDRLWPCLLCLALAGLGAALLRKGDRLWPWLLLTAAFGLVLGQLAWHPALPEERTYAVSGVVSDEVVQKDSLQIHTTLSSITLDGERYLGQAYWSFYADEIPEGLAPGQRVSFTASLYHPSGATNEGGYDFRAYLLQRGVTIGLYGGTDDLALIEGGSLPGALASLRHALLERLRAVMGEEAGAYAGTMLLGVKSLVPTEDRDAFSALGIGHVLSVSGFHVGLLYGLLLALLRLLGVKQDRRLVFVAVPLLFYCALTGGSAAAVRATLLCLLRQGYEDLHRRRSTLHLLSIAALIQLTISPVQLASAGFQLSYGAMLGIGLVLPALQRPKRLRGRASFVGDLARKAAGSLAAAFSAQLGILLPELYWYQELPVLGLLCNVVILVLMTGLLSLYWLTFALMGLPGLGPAIGSAAAWLTSLLLRAVRTFGSQDWLLLWTRQAGWLTAIGWVLAMASLCCVWPRLTKRNAALFSAGLVLIVLSVIPFPSNEVFYTQLDVDAADAAVLYDRGSVTVIDTGEDSTLAGYLHRHRWSVDRLFITHLHSDHAGGIQDLLDEHIPVGVCYLSESAEDAPIDPGMADLIAQLEARGTQIVRVGRGDRVDLTSGSVTVLWPERGRPRAWTDANDSSLMLQAEILGTTLLLTGDITSEYELYGAAPSDILKAAHHGSTTSTSPELLEAVQPRTVLLSCGPVTRTAAFLERTGLTCPLYSTADSGQLTVRFSEGSYTVDTYLR